MTWDDWVAEDPRRQAVETHRSYGASWAEEDPAACRELRFVPGTGEVCVVDPVDGAVEVLGVVHDVALLDEAIEGWEEAQHRAGSLYWLRASIGRPHQLAPGRVDPEVGPPAPAGEPGRSPGSRYRLDEADGSWWDLGWDRPLATFYAQRYLPDTTDPGGMDTGEPSTWLGGRPGELPDLATLEAAVGRRLPAETAFELVADQDALPRKAPPPFTLSTPPAGPRTGPVEQPSFRAWTAADERRDCTHWDFGAYLGEDGAERYGAGWVPATGEVYVIGPGTERPVEVFGRIGDQAVLNAALAGWEDRAMEPGSVYWLRWQVAQARGLEATAAPPLDGGELRAWTADLDDRQSGLEERERALDRRERQLAAERRALHGDGPIEPAWSLPAGPLVGLLTEVRRDTGDDMGTVARGLGLDPAWVQDVVTGAVTEVDLPHVQQVCAGASCSPYDLWGEGAGAVLHAYPPDLWPRTIEPLPRFEADPERPGPDVDFGPGPEIDL